VSYRTIIALISATTTTAGLTIRAEADHTTHRTGTEVSDAELAASPYPDTTSTATGTIRSLKQKLGEPLPHRPGGRSPGKRPPRRAPGLNAARLGVPVAHHQPPSRLVDLVDQARDVRIGLGF
jgi:hypothetical protein